MHEERYNNDIVYRFLSQNHDLSQTFERRDKNKKKRIKVVKVRFRVSDFFDDRIEMNIVVDEEDYY